MGKKPKQTMFSENFDVLYMIRARLSSGASRGAPQLNKDVRVLKKAEKEIEHLRQQRDELLVALEDIAQHTGLGHPIANFARKAIGSVKGGAT